MSNNTIVIIGRLGADPEQKNQSVRLSVAVDRPGKKDGQKQTDWFTVWLHDKQADVAKQYLTKGQLVSVSGRMQCNKMPDGQQFWSIGNASFHMLGSKSDQASPSQSERVETGWIDADEDEFPPF